MKIFNTKWSILISLLMYTGIWIVLYPWLGYMLDSDGAAYLTIAERWARGDYLTAINGLWSPLNEWLMIPFLRQGYNPWKVAQFLNFLFGGMVLIQASNLFKKWIHDNALQWAFALTMPLLLVYFTFYQMFGDVLQMVFVLAYLQILFSSLFTGRISYAIFAGFVMGLGFYAKAYNLLFFCLHFTLSLWWMYKNKREGYPQIWKQYLVGAMIFVLTILPWSVALSKKYNTFTIGGFAGKLNMSWYINSGKSFKPDITLLIPPSYQDSPSFWEDPYRSQENLSSPFSSLKHFTKWVARVIYTGFQTLQCLQEITWLALAILGISWYYLFKKRLPSAFNYQLIWFTILLLPLGYMTMHVETRYLWVLTFLLFILGGYLIKIWELVKPVKLVAIFMLSLSFLTFATLQIENLKNKNRDLFDKAAWFKELKINGSFTSNIADAGQMWVIAYLSHNQFYTIERSDYDVDELIQEMKRYKVKYFMFQAENNVLPFNLPTSIFEKIGTKYGMTVYRFKHEI